MDDTLTIYYQNGKMTINLEAFAISNKAWINKWIKKILVNETNSIRERKSSFEYQRDVLANIYDYLLRYNHKLRTEIDHFPEKKERESNRIKSEIYEWEVDLIKQKQMKKDAKKRGADGRFFYDRELMPCPEDEKLAKESIERLKAELKDLDKQENKLKRTLKQSTRNIDMIYKRWEAMST